MKCPACDHATLKLCRLESHLKASNCGACQGHWIAANDLDHHGERLPEKAPDEMPLEVTDTQEAKLCPHCQCIMRRYRVGHGLDFWIDQCGRCNGVWLDTNEWASLKQRNLHDEIHLIFSADWQSKLRKEDAKRLLNDMYAEHFGDDYDKIKEIKAWLSGHPEKVRIMDYLVNKDPYAVRR